MARKSIFEILEEKYDINDELYNIYSLYSGYNFYYVPAIGPRSYYSIDYIINQIFHKWKAKGTCTSCSNMREKLGISGLHKGIKLSEEEVIFYLEYYANMLYLYSTKIRLSSDYKELNSLSMLRDNIDTLIEHMHYEKHIFAKDERVILIPKNPAATAVAETAPKDIAFAILKYNHASLKGQLEEKRRLLQSIANEYEDLLEKPIEPFGDFFTKTNGLLNNLNIRHNNKKGKNQHEAVVQMNEQELEKWYDETYQLLLFCILSKDNTERKKLADKLLKQFKGQ